MELFWVLQGQLQKKCNKGWFGNYVCSIHAGTWKTTPIKMTDRGKATKIVSGAYILYILNTDDDNINLFETTPERTY